jgi:hypothetical protein
MVDMVDTVAMEVIMDMVDMVDMVDTADMVDMEATVDTARITHTVEKPLLNKISNNG